LLLCKAKAQRISCPRPKCKQIIVLDPSTVRQPQRPSEISPVPGMCRVSCAHCREIFPFNSLMNQLARCPHCERKSSVGRQFSRTRGFIFLFLFSLALIIGVTLTIVAHTKASTGKTGWVAAYILCYISSLYFLYRSLYFLTLKSSIIVENQTL